MRIREQIQNLIKNAVQAIGGQIDAINLMAPGNHQHGDFSTNVAMILAKSLKNNPQEVAQNIIDRILPNKFIDKIEVAGAGFINIFLDKKLVSNEILTKSLAKKFYKTAAAKKVIIEHTSVNPNKSIHVGHLRNAILGNAIANLFNKIGHNVEVQNYIDDTGLQVADTTNAILNLNETQPKSQRFDDWCWDIYAKINKAYETDQKLTDKRKIISHQIESGDNKVAKKAKEISDQIVSCQLEDLTHFQIFYDLLVFESDIIKSGFWEAAFELLKKSPNFFFQKNGKQKNCWVLSYDNPQFGDKILIRSDGTKVYTAKDIAYHFWKFGLLRKDFQYQKWPRQYNSYELWQTCQAGDQKKDFAKADIIINVVDERQIYPQEANKQALKSLGYKEAYRAYHHLAYGVVALSAQTARDLGIKDVEDKNEVAMSGRQGVGVKAHDLLKVTIDKVDRVKKEIEKSVTGKVIQSKQIAEGAIKHYMLKYNPNSKVIFDFEQALKLKGNTGPYLQYSYARAAGILRKAGDYTQTTLKMDDLTEAEYSLIKLIGQWSGLLKEVEKTLIISNIAEYAFELSHAFHRFYEASPVLKSDIKIKNFRLTLIKAFQNVLENVLDVLGIVAPERM